MNWRRGILLAGINLAVAVPLIVMLEARDVAYMREHYADHADHAPPAWIASDPVLKNAPSGKEGQSVGFDPCAMWGAHYPPEELIAPTANFPAMTISGWRQLCPPRWTLAGRLNVGYSWGPLPSTLTAWREVDWGFGLLIALQWILVGGFPLTRPNRWWAEPGAFITCCAVIGFVLVLIRPIEGLARLPASLAAFAWLWWFGLLVWKGGQLLWRLMTRRRLAAS
jgi:hypothetical protein